MQALKKSMKWDEDMFGLELDLDCYMIVAVGDFNMGAMENKGLNIFNTKYVLARPDIATDGDFLNIDRVVAHEYFHNWTGNRVTCRDWFQLSLKEGLTVFRDQEFGADTYSRPVTRIQEVRGLRAAQFPEDAGPMAHPVRPQSYMEISNFYTATVYEKGAEVVRMIHTLIGPRAFRRGMDVYFQRHDGQAVTCDEFVDAMAEGSGFDFAQFKRWYDQAGTPRLDVTGDYDAAAKRYTLTVKQWTPPTPGQPEKLPLAFPLAVGLIAPDGAEIPLQLEGEPTPRGTDRVLSVKQAEERFVFTNVPAKPVPSLLRRFSAPVILGFAYTEAELTHLMAHDADPFNRWEAGQRLATGILLRGIEAHRAGKPVEVPRAFVDAFARVLRRRSAGPGVRRRGARRSRPRRTSPSRWTSSIRTRSTPCASTSGASSRARSATSSLRTYQSLTDLRTLQPGRAVRRQAEPPEPRARLPDGARVDGRLRALRGAVRRRRQHDRPDGGARRARELAGAGARPGPRALLRRDWKHEPLVVDKWLAVQATSRLPDTLARVERLMHHEAFDIRNPNKVYALIRAFCSNHVRFHAADGAGYAFARRPRARARFPQPADRRAHRARVRPLEEVRRRAGRRTPARRWNASARRRACRRTSPRW